MTAQGFPLLSLLTFLPLLGVGALALLRAQEPAHQALARRIALSVSLVQLALSLGLWFGFDRASAAIQFEERAAWLPGTGIGYHMGVDGISVLFVLLVALMTPLCLLACWNAPGARMREQMAAFLLLEGILVGVFSALDLFLFYVFFEAAMVPIFLIIGVWGGEGRARAAMKLFLYTMAGALAMLLAIMALWQRAGSTDLVDLMRLDLSHRAQMLFFLAFFAAFAVKMPLWPMHTWQADAYAESPTVGAVMLGGVMLNMGAYGVLRFAIPLFPDAAASLSPLVFTLSVIAVVYASLVALAQRNMKRLVAYASVAHMGTVAIGLFAMNQQSLSGAVLQMLSHGVVSSALFLCIGILDERLRSQEIERFGGVAKVMPLYATVFMFFAMASVALPGTGSFPGEFLVILGAWKASPWLALGAASSMILGAAYMLWLYRRVLFGAIRRAEIRTLADLSPREIAMLTPLVVLTLWGGIYPSSFLGFFQASVSALIRHQEAALASAARLAGL